MKKIKTIIPATLRSHWVGDGFVVRSVFADIAFTQEISPFLMLDYGEPMAFTPTLEKRSVGPHLHRGLDGNFKSAKTVLGTFPNPMVAIGVYFLRTGF